jgi:hypothetical protein
MDGSRSSLNTTKRRTVYLLLCGLLLSVGTPAHLALSRPGSAGYLLHAEIFAGQSLPYLLAAVLWLPWRSARACELGQVLAGLLLLAAGLLYVPMLTGLWATGGDMVGLAFLAIAGVLTVSLVLITLAACGMLWLRDRVPRR